MDQKPDYDHAIQAYSVSGACFEKATDALIHRLCETRKQFDLYKALLEEFLEAETEDKQKAIALKMDDAIREVVHSINANCISGVFLFSWNFEFGNNPFRRKYRKSKKAA